MKIGMSAKEKKAKIIANVVEVYELDKKDVEEAISKFYACIIDDLKEEYGKEYREAREDGVLDDFWNEMIPEMGDMLVRYMD